MACQPSVTRRTPLVGKHILAARLIVHRGWPVELTWGSSPPQDQDHGHDRRDDSCGVTADGNAKRVGGNMQHGAPPGVDDAPVSRTDFGPALAECGQYAIPPGASPVARCLTTARPRVT